MSRKYRNPPIVEALCEFRFIPSQPWDMTIPGLLYEKVRDEFPEKKQLSQFDIRTRPGKEGGIEQKVETTQRMQFFRKDKTALIQADIDLLTVNHLRPYTTWETFKPTILDALDKYREISNPAGFKRIGLRYINRIEIKEDLIELSDYFKYYPFISDDLPQTHGKFNSRIEIPFEEERDHLVLILASADTAEESKPVLLDLDYFMAKPESITIEGAEEWIENAHKNVENAFEACITDKCRALFEEE